MVRKFLGFLNRESSSLNSAALLLGSFAFLSQFLAFLRDRLLAHIFGASAELDIYYAAFRIPDFIFVTVASVVSLSVLIPFIIEKDSESREALREFIDSVFSFFAVVIAASSALAFALIPYFSETLFRGFSPGELEQVVFISRLLLFSPIILGLSNLFGSITQAYNRFTLYALSPILYNAGIIFGIIILGEKLGVVGVAIGVIAGALLHALVQLPFLISARLLPRLRLGFGGQARFNWDIVRKVVQISLPRTLTLSMSALALIFLVSFASLMEEGSISILSFAINLSSVPLSLIGVSYSLAAFPTLTRRFQERNLAAFVEQMQVSARFIIFWSLPLSALLVVLRAQIVRVLLGTGSFGWPATRLTAAALALFALSALFQSLLLLFMRGFYSAGATFKPFFINLFSTGVLALAAYGLVKIFYASESFSLLLTALLKVEDTSGAAVLMLPLGFSIGTILNGVLLWAAFEKEFRGFSRGVARAFFEGAAASIIMGAAAYLGLNAFDNIFDLETFSGIFLQGLLSGFVAIVSGVLVLRALRSRELSEVWRALRVGFSKEKVIATDPEIV
jgi:putative peptidoglycan lipid II flippase